MAATRIKTNIDKTEGVGNKTTSEKKRFHSIALKTSVPCSIIVLILLTISSLISINL